MRQVIAAMGVACVVGMGIPAWAEQMGKDPMKGDARGDKRMMQGDKGGMQRDTGPMKGEQGAMKSNTGKGDMSKEEAAKHSRK